MPNNLLGLTREQLRKFLPDHQTIRAFEQLLLDVGTSLPTTVEQANNNANTAIAMATAALSALTDVISELDQALMAPSGAHHLEEEDFSLAPGEVDESEDFQPAIAFGTIAIQNADEVEITGGSIDGTSIGVTTPSTGAFTTLTASSTVTLSPANANVTVSPTGTGTATINPATAGTVNNMSIGATTARSGRFTTLETTISAGGSSTKAWILQPSGAYSIGLGPTSTEGIIEYNSGVGAASFFGHRFLVNGTERLKIDGTGLVNVTGSLRSTGAFACNGQAVQTPFALGAAATDLPTVITLANNIRQALINNGIGS